MTACLCAFELLEAITLERITSLQVHVAVIKSNYATKEDIATLHQAITKSEGTLLKWFIGTAVVMASLAFAAAKFIH